MPTTSPSLWLAIGVLAGAMSALITGFLLVPSKLPSPELRGHLAARREEAFRASGFLRAIWPLVRVGSYYAEALGLKRWHADRSTLLRRAGDPAGLSPTEFSGLLFASFILSVAGGVLVAWMFDWGGGVMVLGAFLGAVMPNVWLSEKASDRLRYINRGLPQALDLIVMAMGAGLDFIGALSHVVSRWSNKRDPLYEELLRFVRELHLGKTRKDALEQLAYRAPTELVNEFVANVIQAERRGSPLIEVLSIQAEVARTKRFQAAERVANRAGVLILVPIMFVMAATVLVVFGSLIVKGYRGQLF